MCQLDQAKCFSTLGSRPSDLPAMNNQSVLLFIKDSMFLEVNNLEEITA